MISFLTTDLGRLRLFNLLDGLSYAVLLCVAVPLKYLAGRPEVVQVMGRLHGLFFVLFLLSVAQVATASKWNGRRILHAVAAAVIPFAAFVLEKRLRQDAAEAARAPAALPGGDV